MSMFLQAPPTRTGRMIALLLTVGVGSVQAHDQSGVRVETSGVSAPELFAPGVISGPGNDGSPTFSPDGKTLFFYRYGTAPDSAVILESHRTAAGWSMPVAASFSGPSSDRQPALSADGRTLIYASRRQGVTHLWRVTRTPSGWSVPEPLPDAVNISQRMHNPSIAANGDLYFTCPIDKPGDDVVWGLYRSTYRDGRYDPAQRLSFSGGELLDADDPAIAPDQSYLIFGSHGLHTALGQEHLYIAFRQGVSWGPPIQIHYRADDWPDHGGNGDGEPQISPDGRTLYFVSTRSTPISPDRSRSQLLRDVKRLEAWDNGSSNVWWLPLKQVLDAARHQLQENPSDARN